MSAPDGYEYTKVDPTGLASAMVCTALEWLENEPVSPVISVDIKFLFETVRILGMISARALTETLAGTPHEKLAQIIDEIKNDL